MLYKDLIEGIKFDSIKKVRFVVKIWLVRNGWSSKTLKNELKKVFIDVLVKTVYLL